jgi:hypothetical protein
VGPDVNDSPKGRLGNQARKNLPDPKTQCIKTTSTGGGMAQREGYLIYNNPHLGRLSNQLRTALHDTDSKNLLEHCLSRCQELPGTNKNTMEAPNQLG